MLDIDGNPGDGLEASPARRDVLLGASPADRRRAIAFMAGATAAFSIAGALAKIQIATLPVIEVVFFRSFFAWLPLAVMMALLGRSPRTTRLRAHLGRGVVGFVALMCMFSALAFIPLTDATAISYTSPLFLALMSGPLLGERIKTSAWVVLLMGFTGVLLMFPIGNASLQLGALFALANAVLAAFVSIAVRHMSLSEAPTTLVFYQLGTGALLSLPIMLVWGFTMPDALGWAMLAGIGGMSAVGQFCWAQAFRNASAAVVGPFIYTSLIWVVALDWLIWTELPSLLLLVGAAIVIACAIYALYEQRSV